MELACLGSFHEYTNNEEQFIHRSNNDDDNDIKSTLVVVREERIDASEIVNDCTCVRCVKTDCLLRIRTGITCVPLSFNEIVVNEGPYVVLIRHDEVEEFKRPVHIVLWDEKATEQKRSEPAKPDKTHTCLAAAAKPPSSHFKFILTKSS
mmetsp:Transcript_13608/g.30915  ORF Transcript_13608/g.30915 Transcript_13608/m.30915 type:complete len:150 (-) Transcript_13608:1667-2116(-)